MGASIRSSDSEEFDRSAIPQHLLDIESRVRTNLFPWRGQFSPGLVDVFLSAYSSTNDMVFDPFAGVGTTLIEAARKSLPCTGTEINPAAVAMAETVMFVALTEGEREYWVRKTWEILNDIIPTELPLFGSNAKFEESHVSLLADRVSKLGDTKFVKNITTNVLIRVADSSNCNGGDVVRAFKQHCNIIAGLPYSSQEYRVANADARNSPMDDASVDFVFTSPPYLNVFNYHQNNRKAMELLGWNLLTVAKSEFGSNRKHRGNRFLTVIQYCFDMYDTLRELHRVMKPTSRAVFVVGRESSIRGVPFQNGLLVGRLAELAGFTTCLKQERKFKNKFGALIYEDLLHFVPTTKQPAITHKVLELAVRELECQTALDLKPDVRADLQSAIENASNVKCSPIYVSKL